MAERYVRFSREQFELTLTKISENYQLAFPTYVNDNYNNLSPGEKKLTEHIYSIPSRNYAVSFIIFSGMNAFENEYANTDVRNKVRIYVQWYTQGGTLYKLVGSYSLTKDLFVNIRKALVSESSKVFNLKAHEFSNKDIFSPNYLYKFFWKRCVQLLAVHIFFIDLRFSQSLLRKLLVS